MYIWYQFDCIRLVYPNSNFNLTFNNGTTGFVYVQLNTVYYGLHKFNSDLDNNTFSKWQINSMRFMTLLEGQMEFTVKTMLLIVYLVP